MSDCRTNKHIAMTAAAVDYGPIIEETHQRPFRESAHDQRAAVIAEAARLVAADNPRLNVETIAQERGFMTSLMMDQLAEFVLRARALARGRMGAILAGGVALGAAKLGPAVIRCLL